MSRSFKKTPVNYNHPDSKRGKKLASRKVRNSDMQTGGKSAFFKRLFCSWDIHEYRAYRSRPDESDSDSWKKRWNKFFFRK